jgi:outer membrane immunogenic protein
VAKANSSKAGGEIMATLKQKLLGGVAFLALIETSGAVAASPMPSWTGFYVGAHAGYSWGSVDGDTTHTVILPPSGFGRANMVLFASLGRDINPEGGLGGIQAGYNFQAGRVVYGLETDLTWTGQRDSFDFSGQKNILGEEFNYQETTAAKLQYLGTVRGRIGYASGEFLPYFTGGLAWGRMGMDLNWTLTQPSCVSCVASFYGSEAHTLFGWTLGAGFEYAFAERWSAKIEYLYADLGKQTYFSGVQGGGSFGMRDHIVRFGINFRP